MSFQKNHVILVNERDEWVGTMEKLAAHQSGSLHRAFSVFVMNDRNEMLLQQRAGGKYHSAGLWSNTCCSHPLPGESTLGAAHRRLKEEMGFDCSLQPMFRFRYRADVGDGLIENEYDHIYLGNYEGPVAPNPDEVGNYMFVSVNTLEKWIAVQPEQFTAWFRMAIPRFLEEIKNIQLELT